MVPYVVSSSDVSEILYLIVVLLTRSGGRQLSGTSKVVWGLPFLCFVVVVVGVCFVFVLFVFVCCCCLFVCLFCFCLFCLFCCCYCCCFVVGFLGGYCLGRRPCPYASVMSSVTVGVTPKH